MSDDEEAVLKPTDERLRKAGDAVEDFVTDTGRRTYRVQDVLDMLSSRRIISGDQYSAGKQVYEDWYYGGLAASGVVDPSRDVVDGGTHKPTTESQLERLKDFTAAITSIGKVHANVIISIVLAGETLERYGRRTFRQRDAERAKLQATAALVGALSQLDYYYHGRRHTRGGAAHTQDYRPTMTTASGA